MGEGTRSRRGSRRGRRGRPVDRRAAVGLCGSARGQHGCPALPDETDSTRVVCRLRVEARVNGDASLPLGGLVSDSSVLYPSSRRRTETDRRSLDSSCPRTHHRSRLRRSQSRPGEAVGLSGRRSCWAGSCPSWLDRAQACRTAVSRVRSGRPCLPVRSRCSACCLLLLPRATRSKESRTLHSRAEVRTADGRGVPHSGARTRCRSGEAARGLTSSTRRAERDEREGGVQA